MDLVNWRWDGYTVMHCRLIKVWLCKSIAWCIKDVSPEQLSPFPVYPDLQVQLYGPLVSALPSHLCSAVTHSSISKSHDQHKKFKWRLRTAEYRLQGVKRVQDLWFFFLLSDWLSLYVCKRRRNVLSPLNDYIMHLRLAFYASSRLFEAIEESKPIGLGYWVR